MNFRLYLGIGFGVWLIATIVVRLIGQLIFNGNVALLIGLHVVTIPVIVVIALIAFRIGGLSREQRFLAGILLVLPGMLLDALVVQIFASTFPNIDPLYDANFGGWLLWAYSLVLLSAFIPAGSSQPEASN